MFFRQKKNDPTQKQRDAERREQQEKINFREN